MRKNIYERPRVEKLLDRTSDCPLFVVAAGAGYGKTTAVQAWLKKSGLAWGDSGSDLRRRKPLLGKTLRRPGTLLNRSRRRCHPALCGKNRSPAAAPRSRSRGTIASSGESSTPAGNTPPSPPPEPLRGRAAFGGRERSAPPHRSGQDAQNRRRKARHQGRHREKTPPERLPETRRVEQNRSSPRRLGAAGGGNDPAAIDSR